MSNVVEVMVHLFGTICITTPEKIGHPEQNNNMPTFLCLRVSRRDPVLRNVHVLGLGCGV